MPSYRLNTWLSVADSYNNESKEDPPLLLKSSTPGNLDRADEPTLSHQSRFTSWRVTLTATLCQAPCFGPQRPGLGIKKSAVMRY